MPKIQISSRGIRAALKKYTPYQSLAEYIWNGFDAQASQIDIHYESDELGNLFSISISDNGYGIPHSKLQNKFEPLFESQKALENKLKKNQSALHGKNGIGRLTFFVFARSATWTTTYEDASCNWTYDIFANAENINFYTGINASPKKTQQACGTTVTFSGIHSLNAFLLEDKFSDFLLKEFGWFLALNSKRSFSLSINGKSLDFKKMVADSEKLELIHEKSSTVFEVEYVRWKEKGLNEQSRYYYIDSSGKEKWKEPTAIKSKGEQFYHSVFIQSPYFDAFSFQGKPDSETQQPLLSGTRSDAQFRFLKRKLANFLRIKRRPFLAELAQNLISEYESQNILPKNKHQKLPVLMKTLYEMQPRIFSSLNTERKKMFAGLLGTLLESDKANQTPNIFENIIELSSEEKEELKKIFAD
ncbi:MAG TPA: ATP-binding protein [Patescibacteria group bacterium]